MIAQRQSEQDFIIAHVGGSIVPNSTHRPADILVGLLDAMRTLEEAALVGLRSNLRSDIRSAWAELADQYPGVVTVDGLPTDAVAEQSAALVSDPDVDDELGLSIVKDEVWSAFDQVLARGGLYLDGTDGVGIYVPDPDEDPDLY